MSQTNIPVGDPKAVKAYSVALFTRMARATTFKNKMTGPAPKDSDAARRLKQTTTAAGMPVVEIRDLAKGAGDQCSYDIVDILSGLPVMGDKRVSGKMMSMAFATQQIRIDQMRAGVDPGGRMTRKRTLHDLRKLSMANLEGYNATLLDNLTLVHMAGARGTQQGRDWSSVPLESHPEFGEIVVNPVLPPTPNRRFVVGEGFGGSVAAIDNTDKLSLTVLDQLRTEIDESEYPLQGISIEGDDSDSDDPLYVLRLSPTGYQQLRDTSTDKDWNTLITAAIQRASQSKHPLFKNGDLLWRNILIKKSRRSIVFSAGSNVREYNAAATSISNVTAPENLGRAVLLGAQALACAHGSDEENGYHLNWHEEKTDHGARVEVSTSMIVGMQKLQFTLDGVKTDHGSVTVDFFAG